MFITAVCVIFLINVISCHTMGVEAALLFLSYLVFYPFLGGAGGGGVLYKTVIPVALVGYEMVRYG